MIFTNNKIQSELSPLYSEENFIGSKYSNDLSQELAGKVSKTATPIIKDSNNFKTNVVNSLKWAWSRIKEIPFLIRNPQVLVEKFYRWRVRKAMESQLPQTQTVFLSHIFPAHRLEGNVIAEEKNQQRIEILKKHRNEFAQKLANQEAISQEFIEGLMESTSPIQLAYDEVNKRCIAFDGNSRLIAIKRFFAEFYPNENPKIQIKIYNVNPNLLKHVMPERDFSFPK